MSTRQTDKPVPIIGLGIDARTPNSQDQIPALGSSRPRSALLRAALELDLAPILIEKIFGENPSLEQVRDPEAAKVHTVEIIKLLVNDHVYGPTFRKIIDNIPAWKRYSNQDHSLFISGIEQRQDYFLTDGDLVNRPMIKNEPEY